jgi:hypothetical protein
MEMQQASAVDGDIEARTVKDNRDFVESAVNATLPSEFPAATARLSKLHRDYLMERHGTLNLDPIPAMDPADPYNWPEWKVSPFNAATFIDIRNDAIH